MSLEATSVGLTLSLAVASGTESVSAGWIVSAAAGATTPSVAPCLPFKKIMACALDRAGCDPTFCTVFAACFGAGLAFPSVLESFCQMASDDAEYAGSKFACASVKDALRAKHNLGLFIRFSLFWLRRQMPPQSPRSRLCTSPCVTDSL